MISEAMSSIWDVLGLEIRPPDPYLPHPWTTSCYACARGGQRHSLCGRCLRLAELPLPAPPGPGYCQVCGGKENYDPDWGGCDCPPSLDKREPSRFDPLESD